METNLKSLVLVVDDEPTNLHIMIEALSGEYRVKVATNGEDAIGIALDTDKPDLIILDILMPGMNGYEVCKILKQTELTKSIPVIFITVMGQEEGEIHGLEVGAVDYISKPINIAITRARVNMHIKLKKFQDQLEKQSYIDGLTGISNRRHLDKFLENEWRRNFRNKTCIALIMVDIDFFKKYNDMYGHLAGDDCLIKVANTFNSFLKRPGDLAARYGGEEFIGVLSDTNKAGAHQLAESFRNQLENMAIPHNDSPMGCITISCGVDAMIPSSDIMPTELIIMADKSLYKAKELGRNIVISSLVDDV